MRPVMVGISKYALWLWALNVAVEMAILISMVARKHYRHFPAFFGYICLDLLQATALALAYLKLGFSAAVTERFAWGTQGIVLCARALAIWEICWHSNALAVAGSGLALLLDDVACGAPWAPGGAGLPVVGPGVGASPRSAGASTPGLRRYAVAIVA